MKSINLISQLQSASDVTIKYQLWVFFAVVFLNKKNQVLITYLFITSAVQPLLSIGRTMKMDNKGRERER